MNPSILNDAFFGRLETPAFELRADHGGVFGGKTAFSNATSRDELIFDKTITSDRNMETDDGLSIIISDFFTDGDCKSAADSTGYKKKQVLLIQAMTPDETDHTYTGRVNLIDCGTTSMEDDGNLKVRIGLFNRLAYSQASEDTRSFATFGGAGFTAVNMAEPIEKMLFKELLKVGVIS